MSSHSEKANGNWIRVKVLGSGAFGVVELWKNEFTQENIAIKKCQSPIDKSDKIWARWIQEVRIMNQLNHPNIVKTKQIPEQLINRDGSDAILCMEYCAKGDLRNVLNNCDNLCGIKQEDALKIMHDVSSAVEYLHSREITHRDLKPENIVMQVNKDKIIYKLIDLGYAKSLGVQSVSASIVGTVNYLAPELLWKDTYSCSVDYWSLGILFYEVLTGFRPFLHNAPITETWMQNVKNKKYQDISARDVNGKVVFFNDFEEPHSVPKCIKDDLVDWFRIVLQWNPKKRGRLQQSDELVVFSKLKSVLDKMIGFAFIVPHYKYESFVINSSMTIAKFKEFIFEKEGIEPEEQILTNSEGILLSDDFFSTAKSLVVITVFHSNKLSLSKIPSLNCPKIITEMQVQPHKFCDYPIIKRYCGATIIFMERELGIYRSYILAISTMIDLCDTKLQFVQKDIDELSSGVQILTDKLAAITDFINSPDHQSLNSYLQKFEELKSKVMKFFDGTKKVKERFEDLSRKNEKLKTFSDNDWIGGFSEPYDAAIELTKNWLASDRHKRRKPLEMVQLYLKFLILRTEKLKNSNLEEISSDIIQFLKQLNKLKEVLKSFTALLSHYLHDIDTLYSNTLINKTNVPQNPPGSTDAIVYNSILMSNMLGGLLVEMDVWKRKFADLNYFEGA